MTKRRELSFFGLALLLASEGARFLFYATDNVMLNCLTLLSLLLVLVYVINRLKQ